MTAYILQSMLFQLIFLLFYEVALKRETFFQWNRAYLLLTTVLALGLPLVQIPVMGSYAAQSFSEVLPAVVLGASETNEASSLWTINTFSMLKIIFLIGMAVSAGLFFYKLNKIFQMKQKGKIQNWGSVKLVVLPQSKEAFSFANMLFVGDALAPTDKNHILSHELVHVKQKHFLDLLFFELLRILFWFNPLVYWYQKRIATLHEFIADQEVVSTTDKKDYYQSLLSELFQTHKVSFINTFFNHSLIKNRILMLNKSKSPKTQLVKYALILPLVTAMLFVTSCERDEATSTEIIEKVTEVEEIEIEEAVKIEEVSFNIIDQSPVYPGCENLTTQEEIKSCFSDNIKAHVSQNFDNSLIKELSLPSGILRINTVFKIDNTGNIVNIRCRAPHPLLEEEAIRVLGLIPQLQPGKMADGQAVAVLYSLPIVTKIEEETDE